MTSFKRLAFPSLHAAAAFILLGSLAAAQSLPTPEVLDLEETAALLRVKTEVVSALAESQRIPARRVGEVWRFSHAALLEWLKGDQGTTPTPLPAQPTAKQETVSPPPTVGEQKSTPTAEEIALRDQRVLLKRGIATLDFDAAYGRSQQTLVPVVRVEEGALAGSGTLRYGLANDLQVIARLPAVWRRTATYSDASITGTTVPHIQHEGFAGDASVSLMGIASREAVGRPTLVWSLDGVVPTGPGDSAVGGGLVLSKSYDPIVVFAGASYLYGVSINPADPRRSLARNNLGLQAGYTYALNDNLALSTSLLGAYRNLRSPDGVSIPPPHENYYLRFGMTWLLAHNIFLEPGVAVNVAGDPGVTLSLNFSRAFRMLKKP